MYLGIDVGGTKTLVASLDNKGVIQEEFKFPTPKLYGDFLTQLGATVNKFSIRRFYAAGIGVPASEIDREHGIGSAFPNLPWRKVAIRDDVAKLLGCKVGLENDAKLGALSEAQLVKKASKVLYVALGTGIGIGLVTDGVIDTTLSDSGGAYMMLEHHGKMVTWESFASGHAIYEKFGMEASKITEQSAWQSIAYDISLGLIDLIALLEPDVIILGGGIGTHFEKYQTYLHSYLQDSAMPLMTIPPIKAAERPEKAVVYGGYEIARSMYGKAITVA